MSTESNTKPDAFKAVLAAAQTELGRPELAHQSLGRPLSEAEVALADGIMAAYASGVSGAEAVAAALTEKGVVSPTTGTADWTADSLSTELAALNANLDQAYAENGPGA